MSSLGARLVALSGEVEEKPEKGVWLSEQIKEFKLKERITEDTVRLAKYFRDCLYLTDIFP